MREARELTFVGTRRYVRRQRSWFRRDHRVNWLDVGAGTAADLVAAALKAWRQVP
jgi:tRNA dimethylallyltransferase